MSVCFKCGAPLPARDGIFRTTRCEQCGADVRVCRNCEFYAPGLHWDCRETISEAVRDKDRANFCDFFRPAAGHGSGSEDGGPGARAQNGFRKLFGAD